jgi:UDP-N-acetylglucosamine:LPS N-acetylglucosamine transferase
MKYPYWNEYDNAKKWKAVEAELAMETNNATTKADLTNMIKFLRQEEARLQAVMANWNIVQPIDKEGER